MQLEERSCYKCGRKFKTLATSNQGNCSHLCLDITKERLRLAPKRKSLKKSQAQLNELGKKQKENGTSIMPTRSLERESMRDPERDTKETKKKPLKGPEKNIMPIEKNGSLNERLGLKTIEKGKELMQENITPKIESAQKTGLMPTEKALIQPEDSKDLFTMSQEATGQSMTLLTATSEHLFSLMKGLSANQPDPEIKNFDPDRVRAACECAKNIYSIMRLKLDAIKLREELK